MGGGGGGGKGGGGKALASVASSLMGGGEPAASAPVYVAPPPPPPSASEAQDIAPPSPIESSAPSITSDTSANTPDTVRVDNTRRRRRGSGSLISLSDNSNPTILGG